MQGFRAGILLAAAAVAVDLARPARADDDPLRARAFDEAAALGPLAGPAIDRGPLRPDDAAFPARACSFRHPLCVHAPRGAPPAQLLAALASAEHAWDAATRALDLPPPDPDPVTRAYDVYLVDDDALATTALSARDARASFDRASAFTRIPRKTRGCALDRDVARELLRAVLFRVAPAIDDGSARAQTTSLAELVAPCAPIDAPLFQAHPERPFVDTWAEAPRELGARFDEGAALVYDWMDARFDAAPGAIVRALWALSPTMTAPGALHWNDEPDTFDVLRETFKGFLSTGSTVDDLYREIGVGRYFYGSETGAPVRVDWTLEWPREPRRIAVTRGVAPTGASYVVIRRDGAPKGSRLRLEAEWEQHAKMRWMVVKLDAAGREQARIPIPSMERATAAQMSVAELDDTASVLVVGVNAGDPEYPFDPDDVAWEPHGWLLTVAAE